MEDHYYETKRQKTHEVLRLLFWFAVITALLSLLYTFAFHDETQPIQEDLTHGTAAKG